MAYRSSSFYGEEDGYGEYNSYYPLNPSNYYNDSALNRDSMAMDSYYSSYSSEYSVPFYYDSDVSFPRFSRNIAYSVSAISEPKYVEYYEPVIAPTRFVVSYSVQEFNETDFEEYDPTPYGGGFDLAQTYGKPLPPSDQTCYPRSSPSPVIFEKEEPLKENEEVKKEIVPESELEPEPKTSEEKTDKQQETSQEGEIKEKSTENYHPGTGSVTQLPYGYGLEAIDICEGLFGYWPCLSNYRKKLDDECQEINYYDYGNQSYNQWDRTADYLFGNPNPYEERHDDGSCSWNGMYGYQEVESAQNYWYNS